MGLDETPAPWGQAATAVSVFAWRRCSAASASSSRDANPACTTALQYGAGMLFNLRHGLTVFGLTSMARAKAETPFASLMMSA